MLRCEQVTIERGGVTVVELLSVAVERGEVVTLLGPSGAGKSSLLLAIAGLVDVADGRIEVDGRDVAGTPPHRRGVGLVFQEYALFPHLDVAANLTYGLHGDGRSDREHVAVAHDWLRRVGLPPDEFAHRDVATLSGGQRQRVALARALAPDPAVLLLDEPLGALDRQLREELLDELVEVVRRPEGPAVIAVTHDRDEAFTLGDRVGVLRDGRLVALDTPAALWARPGSTWAARFLGHDNVLDHADATTLGLRVGGDVAVPGAAITLDDTATLRGHVTGDAWRDGRRRLQLDAAGVALTAEAPPDDPHQRGDEVGIRIDRARVTDV